MQHNIKKIINIDYNTCYETYPCKHKVTYINNDDKTVCNLIDSITILELIIIHTDFIPPIGLFEHYAEPGCNFITMLDNQKQTIIKEILKKTLQKILLLQCLS